MDERVEKELARLRAYPQGGYYTFLHHEGPIVEHSRNLEERVGYILKDKPKSEVYDRLRHIYWAGDDYAAKREPLGDDYYVKVKLLDDEILTIIPNCSWDGKSIFGTK